MGLTIPMPNVVAADNLGHSDMPAKGSFLAYHLFGGDEAASVRNRINEAQPLDVIGAPTYTDDSAVLSGDDGFRTPFTTPALDRTTFLVFTDPHRDNSNNLETNPPASPVMASLGDRKILHWGSIDEFAGPQYVIFTGSVTNFRPTASSSDYAQSNIANQPLDRAIYYPDGTIQRGRFSLGAFTAKAGDLPMMLLQNDGVLEKSVPARVSTDPLAGSLTDAATSIGAGYPSVSIPETHRFEIAAFAVASALDEATARTCAQFIAADVEARGIRFWTSAQGAAV